MPQADTPCSGCDGERDRPGQRYCRACHAAFMREWRKTHRLSGVAREKAIVRSYSREMVKRGKLVQAACACGREDVQIHHNDYGNPMDVVFVCRPCHLVLHRKMA